MHRTTATLVIAMVRGCSRGASVCLPGFMVDAGFAVVSRWGSMILSKTRSHFLFLTLLSMTVSNRRDAFCYLHFYADSCSVFQSCNKFGARKPRSRGERSDEGDLRRPFDGYYEYCSQNGRRPRRQAQKRCLFASFPAIICVYALYKFNRMMKS